MSQAALSGYPKGWFVVCFSADLPAGGVRPLHYFGRHMVAFRGDDGAARVIDAHCPHLGAHLGYGGKVVGGCVQCPFHAWEFDGSGQCTRVPYATKIPPRAQVGAWTTRELNGVVLVHHDIAGGAPDFEIPAIPEHGSSDWLPWSTGIYHIKTHPREIVDNLADRAHFPEVHRTEIDDFSFEVDGHRATQKVKGRAFFPGGVDPFSSTTTYHGPAYFVMRMDGLLKNYMLLAHTPIDEHSLDLRIAVMLKVVGDRSKTEGYMGRYMQNLRSGFEDDLRIWERKVYREPALLVEGDGPIGRLRRWYRQFYAAGEAASGG
jgi:phenylpropionate dioxygenase-like ring-hydroxylating dioxygenase large terminal subunit